MEKIAKYQSFETICANFLDEALGVFCGFPLDSSNVFCENDGTFSFGDHEVKH